MSAPFTTIDANTDLQDLSLYTQIYRAYQQRHDAANTPAMDPVFAPAAGHDIQYYDLYSQLQAWLDGSGSESWYRYLDHTAAVVGQADLPFYTQAQWRYVAGLHPDGFRRVPGADWPADWTDLNDPAYQYGLCQPGDIIGPWLLVDLQRGFSALRHSWANPVHTALASYYETWSDWAAMTANPVFSGAPYPFGDLFLTRSLETVELSGGGSEVVGLFGRVNLSINPWSGVDRTVRLYAFHWGDDYVLNGMGDFTLVDGGNLLHESGPHKLLVSWDSPSSMSFTPPADPGTDWFVGYKLFYPGAVIQWDFDNI